MEDTTTLGILARLKEASNSVTDIELARKLGHSKQAIADAKSKNSVPASWIPKAAKRFNVTTDWLFFGVGPMRRSEDPGAQMPAFSKEPERPPQDANLENRLVFSEEERRELASENRKLHREKEELYREKEELYREKEELLREIGELREKVARLEERKNRLAVASDQPAQNSGVA